VIMQAEQGWRERSSQRSYEEQQVLSRFYLLELMIDSTNNSLETSSTTIDSASQAW